MIAHALLAEILPRFNSEEYLETKEYKGGQQNELKEALKVMGFYSQKHVERAERGLKRSFYPEYVLSQMTIDEEIVKIERKKAVEEEGGKAWSENKQKSKSAKQIKSQIPSKIQKKNSDNLFGSDQMEQITNKEVTQSGLIHKRFKKE